MSRRASAWVPMRANPLAGVKVGALSASGLAELGKQGIVVTDQVVKDLNVPVMRQALELQDTVFAIADDLGIGTEVRTAVYALRGANYANTTAAGILGVQAGSTAAASGVLTGIGGVAALGAVAVVAFVGFAVFGGGESDEDVKRRKDAQADLLHLRDRLSLADFAEEQDNIAIQEVSMANLAKAMPGFGSPYEHAQAHELAVKLAAFYRTAASALPASERDLFESLSNMARWQGVRNAYAKMSWPQKDALDVLWGKSAPRTEYQMKHAQDEELPHLQELVAKVQDERAAAARSGAWPIILLGGLALGGVALAFPAAAGTAAGKALSLSASLYRKARGIV